MKKLKIYDAHIHIFSGEHAGDMARRAGHENSTAHLASEYDRLGIAGSVVMGNSPLTLEAHVYPDFMHYCIGLDTHTQWEDDRKNAVDLVEQHLKRDACVGIKLYPGYSRHYIFDPMFSPVYELAGHYDKPVAVHTGETAFPHAHLEYCHPLTLDKAAASFPRVNFVMCHLGNPWIVDAAAVMSKNKNVAADLSGILEGISDMRVYFSEQEGYINHIKTWLAYMNAYDRLMFGTDWPLANIENYINFVSHIIPEKHHEKVFSANAMRIYGLE